MDLRPEVQETLKEIEERDATDVNDGTVNEKRVRCVTREVGELLHMLVLLARPRLILELGTSAGYSTIWMGAAAEQVGSRVISVDLDADKVAWARSNVERAKLQTVVEIIRDEAVDFINKSEGPFEMVFMDHRARFYVDTFNALLGKIPTNGCVLVDGWKIVDRWFTEQAFANYRERVMSDPAFQSFLLPFQKGLMISIRVRSDNG